MKTKRFIYFEPFTYLKFTIEHILLYNTLSGAKKIINNDSQLYKYLTYLKRSNNRIIQIEKELINNVVFDMFIQSLKKLYCGDLLSLEENSIPPYLCNPGLVIEEDRHIFLNDNYKGNFRVDSLTEYLHEISIFINVPCEHTCSYCEEAFNQFNCCHKFISDINGFKKISEILFPQLKHYSIKRVNIIAGDIDIINRYLTLINQYLQFAIEIRVICHAKRSLNSSKNKYIFSNQRVWLTILLDDSISIKTIKNILHFYHELNSRLSFNFIIDGENSLNYFNKIYPLIKTYHLNIYPTFNGRNKTFIKEQLSLSKGEILKSTHSFQDLELNKIINSNFFGKIFIYPDGTIKTNRNIDPIGSLYKTTLKHLILKELKSNNSWKLVRSKVSPCKECLFVDLCPPISEIALLLKQFDICKITEFK